MDKPHILKSREAVLIAANHPNSFLDAVIFDIIFDVPVTSLARGDAFKNPKVYKILRALHMLPVYRSREGAENLNSNYDTFNKCMELFRDKEGVLIFSEGICVNEWHLRPLKKGTARLAFQSWQEGISLNVLPAGINYSSFSKYGKKVNIHFGDYITSGEFDFDKTDGFNNNLFNEKLKGQLQQLVYEIEPGDMRLLEDKFGKTSFLRKTIYAPLALAGIAAHIPLYGAAKFVAGRFFDKTNHYDSVMFALPLLLYPLYAIIISFIVYALTTSLWCTGAVLLLLPLSAYAYAKYEVRKG